MKETEVNKVAWGHQGIDVYRFYYIIYSVKIFCV